MSYANRPAVPTPPHPDTAEPASIDRLLDIMAALRTPETGCPWDLAQTFATIAPFTIEEAYEVADAILRGDRKDLCDELGDLLLQVVFHARIAEEEGSFSFADVVRAISDKMVRRHPHVFGASEGDRPDVATVNDTWRSIKAQEKAGAGTPAGQGLLDGVPTALPAFNVATKLQARAAEVGFDWPDARPVLDKIEEEAREVRAALSDRDPTALEEEIGDLIFAMVNLARHARVDPEIALRRANLKFRRRFGLVEAALGRLGKSPSDSTLAEMEQLWQAAKSGEPSR